MDKFKLCVDGASWCVVIASIAGWLPPIAAGFTIIWTGIQIYTWVRAKRTRKE